MFITLLQNLIKYFIKNTNVTYPFCSVGSFTGGHLYSYFLVAYLSNRYSLQHQRASGSDAQTELQVTLLLRFKFI